MFFTFKRRFITNLKKNWIQLFIWIILCGWNINDLWLFWCEILFFIHLGLLLIFHMKCFWIVFGNMNGLLMMNILMLFAFLIFINWFLVIIQVRHYLSCRFLFSIFLFQVILFILFYWKQFWRGGSLQFWFLNYFEQVFFVDYIIIRTTWNITWFLFIVYTFG